MHLASGTAGGGIDLSILAQYGVLGVFAVLLIIFANSTYRREVARADRLESEVLRLNALIQEKHIPALEAAAHALKEATEVMRELQRDRSVRYREIGRDERRPERD